MISRLAIAITVFAAALPLAAQTSSLQGTITDEQGAVIPLAIVTATNADTAATRQALANDAGVYSFLQMAPGMYKIEAQKPGFTTYRSEVLLQVSLASTMNIKLTVGKTTDTVNVTAEVSQVETENATVGNPFTETQIKELPLQTRNVVALLSLEPGVSSTGQVLGARKSKVCK